MAELMQTGTAIGVAEELLALLADDVRQAAEIEDRVGMNNLPTDQQYHVAGAELNDHIGALWRAEGRQIMIMHPELVDAVGTAKGDVVAEVLRALPYRNPLVCLGDPIEVATDPNTGTVGHLAGFFCYGRSDTGDYAGTEALIGTHDRDSVRLGVLALITIRDQRTGGLVDAEFNRLSIPLTTQPQDIAALASDIVRRGHFTDFNGTRSGASEYIENALRHILGTLMYLCSTTLDTEIIPTSRARKMKTGAIARNKPPKLLKVGWRLGPALTTARKEAEASHGTGTGRKQRPHQRSAHFKIVWTEKGRTTPRLTFIAPYMTGAKGVTENTVHIARPAKRDGGQQ